MPSRGDVETFAQANRDVRRLALADLARFWATLNPADAIGMRDALLEFVPLLVAQYGEIAAAVAADFYDGLRDQSDARGRFRAVLADPVPTEAVMANVRWALTPIFRADGADPDAALGLLRQKVDEKVLQPGRDTIAVSSGHDPAKPTWARVPVGKTCAFCLMLASRGAVYRSADAAARNFHGGDDCTPTPFWRGDAYPDGYNPDALFQQYNAARTAADSSRPKAILAELRQQTGGH
jgi:hypothetical protein